MRQVLSLFMILCLFSCAKESVSEFEKEIQLNQSSTEIPVSLKKGPDPHCHDHNEEGYVSITYHEGVFSATPVLFHSIPFYYDFPSVSVGVIIVSSPSGTLYRLDITYENNGDDEYLSEVYNGVSGDWFTREECEETTLGLSYSSSNPAGLLGIVVLEESQLECLAGCEELRIPSSWTY